MSHPMPDIRLFTALPSEAKPINHHFGLQRAQDATAYTLFQNRSVQLIISGVGDDAAARAVRWSAEQHPPAANTCWINIGIAGHATRDLGEVVMADTIFHEQGGCLKIPPPSDPPCDLATVVTVTKPVTDYPDDRVYDMEAFSFLSAVRHCHPAGNVQCLKIISDNRENAIEHISRQLITRLITDSMDTLSVLIARGGYRP